MRACICFCLVFILLTPLPLPAAKKGGDGLVVLEGHKDGKKVLVYLHVKTVPLWTKDELDSIEWHELKGSHFLIHYTTVKKVDGKMIKEAEKLRGQKRFAENVLKAAEGYYKDLADKLGYRNQMNLWTWGKRTDIYLFPDHASYMQLAGRPNWSGGSVNIGKKQISGYTWETEEEFIDYILPHELAHLMIRDFIGFKKDVPLWLDEGIAQWCEKDKVEVARRRAKDWLSLDKLDTVETLMAMKQEQLTRMQWEQADKWYLEVLSLIDFLLEEHGTKEFQKLCEQLKKNKPMNEALKFAYSTTMRDMQAFNEQWREYVKETDTKEKASIYVRF